MVHRVLCALLDRQLEPGEGIRALPPTTQTTQYERSVERIILGFSKRYILPI